MKIKARFARIHWILSMQFGLNFILFIKGLRNIPRYLRDLAKFRRNYHGALEIVPCLHDWHEEGGATTSEYFWQDLLVARMIAEANPIRHVDIGSRIDGFVAHVASFRDIEVFDIRPITTKVSGIIFRQANLMSLNNEFLVEGGYCDSISCLHTTEHFGLGRYGDPVVQNGYLDGISGIGKMLKAGGILYLSVPSGMERVEFNANRVFNPNTIIDAAGANGLSLQRLIKVGQNAQIDYLAPNMPEIDNIALERYALCIYQFKKQ